MKENHNPHKEEFQIERIAFFSDAVFAIAITLLILEIKIPELPGKSSPTDGEFINFFLTVMLQKFIGFIVSFLVIGLYWMVHHRMFNYIIHYNKKLMWTNLFFLLSVVLMPFSSAFLSDYFLLMSHVPLGFYTFNICLTGFMTYRLWHIIADPKYHLSDGAGDKILMRYNTIRSFTIPGAFVVVFLLSFINPWVSFYGLPLLPFVSKMINNHYKKKYPEMMKAHVLKY